MPHPLLTDDEERSGASTAAVPDTSIASASLIRKETQLPAHWGRRTEFELYDLPMTSLTDGCPMPQPKIVAFVEGVCVREALLDTGAAVNILDYARFPKWMTLEPAPATLFAANGANIYAEYTISLKVRALGTNSATSFVVLRNCIWPISFGYQLVPQSSSFTPRRS